MANHPEKSKTKETIDPATATIHVEAVLPGYYDHTFRKPGDRFTLRPVLKADGSIQPAAAQLSLNRKNTKGEFVRGWMKVCGPGAPAGAKPAPLVPQTRALDYPRPEGSLPDPDLDGGADERFKPWHHGRPFLLKIGSADLRPAP